MKRSLYTGLHYLMMPLVVGRLKWLAKKHPDYDKNIGERFGRVSRRNDAPIWIHAVSVGETIAAAPLIQKLQAQHPDWPLLLTNTTPTGAEQARRLFGEGISQHYAPYDTPTAINRFLDNVRPRALVIVETELWPNWIVALGKRKIPVMVANARMSEKSAAGYARLGTMVSDMMGGLSAVAAQYTADAQRFVALGASARVVQTTGNIKADIALTDQDRRIAELAQAQCGNRRQPIILAASTHSGEDEILLDALIKLRESYPEILLYIVPRHPARADDISKLAEQRGLVSLKRSTEDVLMPERCTVIIGDQMGELRGLLGVADLVVMGGTLVDHGGHNPLEPAAWKLPVLAGPSQRNFDSLFQEMEAAGALARTSNDVDSVVSSVTNLWENPEYRVAMGEAAFSYLEGQQGAAERMLSILESLIE